MLHCSFFGLDGKLIEVGEYTLPILPLDIMKMDVQNEKTKMTLLVMHWFKNLHIYLFYAKEKACGFVSH